MPNQTFFNIDIDKRTKIINAAIDEFAENTLQNASVAGIVKKAGIPRGSFYQYFANLEDLYEYLIDYIGQKKVEYVSPVLKKDDTSDPFVTLRETYKMAVEFNRNYPKFAAISNNIFKEKESTKNSVIKKQKEKGRKEVEELLKKGQEKGSIDESVDVKAASFVITSSNAAIMDYHLAQSGYTDLSKYDDILEQVNQVLYILENGLKKD